MYKVEYFVKVGGGAELEWEINDWLRCHPEVIPINISINADAHRAMLLYKEEE